ncbi:sigma 54-interacting transcriptional regulator, partial [bacterium]|nr:sigma 54-interacting transcriptional regulator [bacterium]
LIRSAHGGTLFLDEVGELDLQTQVKLLRWLDQGEVRSLGSTKYEMVRTRLVAATNVDLPSAVGKGAFRLDLYERLSVLTLQVPALRERLEDIGLIARGFLRQHSVEFDESVLGLLGQFHWPGNIRQLRNVLLRAVARCRGRISGPSLQALLDEEKSFSQAIMEGPEPSLTDSSLADIEKRVIIDRIRRCHGNKKKAAKELGIAKSTLHEKIRRWGQEEPLGFGDTSCVLG